MAYYADIREHIKALKAHGKLVTVSREINKDTELMPLVRWQFRGLPDEERKAFLFENVVDVKGRKYDIPILVAALAASKEVYAIGMKCEPDKIMQRWFEARQHPIEPKIVNDGPVHEEVHAGKGLLEHGGLDEFPTPISTPGFDNAPYFSAACWVTKEPGTGRVNIGTYRAMIKSPTRTGIQCHYPQHLRLHWEKCRELGKPLPAAIVMGTSPNIGYVSVAKIPYEVSEYTIAGGLAGAPVELVKCKTVDIEVPATAEIVIEGELPTDSLEPEGPFGEMPGYMGGKMQNLYFNVTCITHRKNPICNAWLSQMPPSESTVMRAMANEAGLLNFLKNELGIPGIKDVAFHNDSGSTQFCVVSLKKVDIPQGWRALHGVLAQTPGHSKIVIVVDDDIDPHDIDSVVWALAYRMQPDTDVKILPRIRGAELDPSAIPPGEEKTARDALMSAMLIDATRKFAYPPLSLPAREFMEGAKKIWEELGLPALKPKVPWFGYSLGYWTKEDAEEAALALKGEHYQTGEKLVKQRAKPGSV